MLSLKRRNINNQKISMKEQVNIYQDESHLFVKMKFPSGFVVNKIALYNKALNKELNFTVNKTSEDYLFKMNLEKFTDILSGAQNEKIDSLMEDHISERLGIWSWYADITVDKATTSPDILSRIKESYEAQQTDNIEYHPTLWTESNIDFSRYVRIGKFQETDIKALNIFTHDADKVLNYINIHGYLVTAINENVKGTQKIQIENLKTFKNTAVLEGKLNTGFFAIENAQIILKSRKMDSEYSFLAEMNRDDKIFKHKYGRNVYWFKTAMNFDYLLDISEDVYDVFLEVKMANQEEKIRLRVGRPTFRARHFFGEVVGNHGNNVMLINPYYTVSKSNLSFEVFPFKKDNYHYLKKIQKHSKLLQRLHEKNDIWIVGERPYKAQDTGYHFFKYMRENHPNKQVYYVITEDSPELENIVKLGNVLIFGSKEHIKKIMIATKIFSSHHADYLYPLRTQKFKNKVKATKIFIQHGVLGLKKLNHMYSKNSKTFETDLFITSSDYEKHYVMNDMGYQSKDVVVTGLSRFDALFKEDVAFKKQILIIPTWREWVQNIDNFLESEYYERYSSLVNNPDLIQYAQQHNYEIVLCLHPNMQNFSSYFEGSSVRVVYQGEVDVQTLIKESALMITDYSSVAFDFSFLHKPVVYYQFDRERFIGKRGSHIDVVNDLPGDISGDEEELVNIICGYIDNGCEMKEEYKKKANRFIKYRDQHSAKRIYEEAIQYKKEEHLLEKLTKNKFLKDSFKKFRKSKRYFPTMKKLYTAMRILLPIDQKKVLFESGIGKGFGDSPKEIFEVLQKERKDLKFVWVYNKNLPKPYDRTRVIRRLNPAYYYHLATAKYWVNNQNFPTYIKKPKGTTYLQTWHGTPLKRMLHDIEEIHGRDETYLERVSEAVKTWDYLVSPSAYATNSFKSAFQYQGKVIEEGYPRNDVFYREQDAWEMRELKQKLEIPANKKVILYAPTFRDNQKKGKQFTMDLPIDFEVFQQQLGDEYVLLIRLHVVVSKKVKIDDEYKDTIINVSNYPDIQELMLLSDLLITDYSSVFFDYLNTDKPILFYTYDLEEYRDQLRGFYMDFEREAPGPLCLTEQSLYDAITHLEKTKEQYAERYAIGKEKFCYLDDGQAAERVVEKVF